MSDSTAALRHQTGSATDLQSVVRTMRALAASSIHQFEQSVLALADYRRTVEQGLGACLRGDAQGRAPSASGFTEASVGSKAGMTVGLAVGSAVGTTQRKDAAVGLIVFGSDQGLVGRFNEIIVEYVAAALPTLPGRHVVWAVGERLRARLEDSGIPVAAFHPLPGSVEGIAPLVDALLLEAETHVSLKAAPHLEIIHNRPLAGALFEPVRQRLLPLDAAWRSALINQPWPAACLPQVMGSGDTTLRALIREHLFISLFQACAESLASENASRLAAMQRADQNIDELLADLHGRFHRQRQDAIDEELFDVTAGFVALGRGAAA